MHHDHDRRAFDDAAPISSPTTSNVVPLRPDQPPAPARKAHRKHPPAKPRPPYTGNRVQDSPYYIEPTVVLDLLLAVTLDRELTPSARDVFGLIVAHYSNRKGYAFPGRERLAELLALTETAISAAIKLLVERGWLLVEQTRADGHKGVNHYFPQLDKLAAIVTGAGFKLRKSGPKVRSDDEQGPVSQGSKVRSDEVSRSGKPDTNPQTEPTEDNPEREPGAPEGAVSLDVMDDWFELFWDEYPRQDDKPAARREFARVITKHGNVYGELMNNLVAYRNNVGTEIVFKPANWLSKGQWKITRTAPKPVAPKVQRDRWS